MNPLMILLALLLVDPAMRVERLRSPWDGLKIAATDAPFQCPDPPVFAKTLVSEGYYTDSNYSVIDPAKLAAYEKASEGPVHLGQYAGQAADAYLSSGSKGAAACVYSLLAAAAKADAWAGQMPNGQSVYDQNWMLSGTAIAYLKVRNSGAGSAQQDVEIQQWFTHVAGRVRTYFDRGKGHPKSDSYNNHMYWAGLSLTATGIANNDRDALLWGLATYYQGVDSIEADGSLDAEMNRKARALHYQLYAAGPLIVLAELGEANGLEMYNVNHGAIHRLVKFNVAAVEDPAIIAKRVGVEQDVKQPLSGLEIGWAVPYVKRFPDAQLSAMIAKAPWVRFWQWGGAPPEAEVPRPAVSKERAAFEADLQHRVNESVRAQFVSDLSEAAAFVGVWCGQGRPEVHTSIADSGPVLTLTNENGETSTGRLDGKRSIVAPGWQNVIGTLNSRGSQIDWSNGTYWERCEVAGAGGGSQRVNLSGEWVPMGVVGAPCLIHQHGPNLQITCAGVGHATARMDGDAHLTSDWSGKTIGATVTVDRDHINWDNQTYWTRARLYEAGGK